VPRSPHAGVPAPQAGADPGTPPDPDLFGEAAETFAMLASPVRLHLLWLLARGAMDVGTLAEAVGGSVATVSQHLAKMRLTDLVSARRRGKHQVYELDDPHVVTLLQQALDHQADLRARRPPARG